LVKNDQVMVSRWPLGHGHRSENRPLTRHGGLNHRSENRPLTRHGSLNRQALGDFRYVFRQSRKWARLRQCASLKTAPGSRS